MTNKWHNTYDFTITNQCLKTTFSCPNKWPQAITAHTLPGSLLWHCWDWLPQATPFHPCWGQQVQHHKSSFPASSFPVLPIILSHQVPRGKPCSLSTMTWMTFFFFIPRPFQPFRTSFVWMCSVLEQSSTLWVTISLETCGLSYARDRGPWGWHYSCSHRAHGWPRTTHNYIGLRL